MGRENPKTQTLTLAAATTYNIITGAAGTGGAGGAAAGNPGTNGNPGGATVFSSGESTTFNGTPGTALSSLGTLAVVSNAGMPTSGSGLIYTAISGAAANGWQQFSYTGLGTNTLTGCTYVGPQNSTVPASAPVLAGSQDNDCCSRRGGNQWAGQHYWSFAAAPNATSGLYGGGFAGPPTGLPFVDVGAGCGGTWSLTSQTLPAPGGIGAGAGGGQAGQCAGGALGGVGGRPGSFSYTPASARFGKQLGNRWRLSIRRSGD